MSKIPVKDRYDFFGPYQVSKGKAYIKTTYMPFEVGSEELAQICQNRMRAAHEEMVKWQELDDINYQALRAEEMERKKNAP